MYLSVGEYEGSGFSGYVGIIRDLTEDVRRRDAFDRLQQAHFHLSRVSAMDQMGSAIAHELNQPLTAIMNYLEAGQVILGRDIEDQADRIKNIMQKSSDQARRAAQILARLRQFIETGDVEKSTVDLPDIARQSLELVEPMVRKNQIEVRLKVEPDLPYVVANAVQLQQVLVNLIRNASEAMESARYKNLEVEVSKFGADMVQVSISDTGPGLEPKTMETIFEPFNSTKSGGLGVGLSISRTIINNHNGRLWAEPNLPTGTIFNFTIPIEGI